MKTGLSREPFRGKDYGRCRLRRFFSLICSSRLMKKRKKQGGLFTDDASLIENFTSARVKLVENRVPNIKITYPEDLLFAEACRKQR